MTSAAETRLFQVLGGSSALELAANRVGATTVFVYGSQARGDHESSSDLEVGLVVPANLGDGASAAFAEAVSPSIRARYYTFSRERLKAGTPDVPFTRRIFIAELRHSAVTVYGEPLASLVPVLPIRPGDLFEEHGFIRARVLDGLICAREGHSTTAAALCWKASYMAGRLFILATEGKMVTNRDELWEYPWPLGVRGLRDWMEIDRAQTLINEGAGNVRRLSKILTQDVYDALSECREAFLVAPTD